MKFINKFKLNIGATLSDIVISIGIMIILGGTIAGMFYKLYYNTTMIRLNAIAVNYAVSILEDIDKLSYEDVSENVNYKVKFNIPDNFRVTLNVDKYSDENLNKEDIIKIVELTIKYSLQDGEEEQFNIKKLKIKEI